MAAAGVNVAVADVAGAGVAGAIVPAPAVMAAAGGALMGPGFSESEPRDSESGISEGLTALAIALALELEPRRDTDFDLLDMGDNGTERENEGNSYIASEGEKLGTEFKRRTLN